MNIVGLLFLSFVLGFGFGLVLKLIRSSFSGWFN